MSNNNQNIIDLFDNLNAKLEDKTLKKKIVAFLNIISKNLKAIILCINISDDETKDEPLDSIKYTEI